MKKPRVTSEQVRLLARRAIVDEYGDLLVQLAPHKASFARLEALKKTIREWFVDMPADESFVAHGENYEATLGPKGSQTRIEDMQGVYQSMGHDDFVALCSMTLANLEKGCTDTRAATFTVVEQTGPRPLTIAESAE